MAWIASTVDFLQSPPTFAFAWLAESQAYRALRDGLLAPPSQPHSLPALLEHASLLNTYLGPLAPTVPSAKHPSPDPPRLAPSYVQVLAVGPPLCDLLTQCHDASALLPLSITWLWFLHIISHCLRLCYVFAHLSIVFLLQVGLWSCPVYCYRCHTGQFSAQGAHLIFTEWMNESFFNFLKI